MTHNVQSAPHSFTAAQVLVDSLRLHGVDRVFCVPGESYLAVLDALYDAREDIHLVVAKHEGGASNMAEADGKMTGRPGVCMVTRGPGATQASNGVHTAQQDSTPMILFVGQISRSDMGRDVFQEVDYHAMFGKLAKWVVEVTDAERMAEIIARAFHVAVSGRPGPVVVSLPEDMLTELTSTSAFRSTALAPVAPPADAMQSAMQILAGAKRPLVVVGGSAWDQAASQDLMAFASAWNLPVACSFRRQDAFDNQHPQYVGHMSLGMNPALKQMVQEADVILALGTRLTDTATDQYTLIQAPQPKQRLIHIHPDEAEIGRTIRPEIGIQASISAAAAALAEIAPPGNPAWSGWTQAGRVAQQAFTVAPALPLQTTGVNLAKVIQHLDQILPDDALLTNGAGNYTVWLHRFYQYRQARTQLAPVCGAMGYGLPAAVAASLRYPDRPVVCLAGDGCFLMYPQELATAAEHGSHLIVIVVNNGIYGTIRMHQEKHFPGRVSGTRLPGPDYVALAKAFGGYAERIERTEDFAAAFERAQASGGIALLEVVTDPNQINPTTRIA